jgi:hypothetical protein
MAQRVFDVNPADIEEPVAEDRSVVEPGHFRHYTAISHIAEGCNRVRKPIGLKSKIGGVEMGRLFTLRERRT